MILETFEGFVDQIRDGVAYFTLKSEHGDTLWGEYDAEKLGVRERRRFICKTIEEDGEVSIQIEPIPEKVITEERWKEICRDIDERFGE